jgi:hypothetical protein
MRIVSVRVASVARVVGIAYAGFGIVAFYLFAVHGAEQLTLPVGIVAPLVYLNLNLHLARSTSVFYNIFLALSSVISYGLTGLLTGAVSALCFNFVAKHTGGIDAKYVTTVHKADSSNPLTETNHPTISKDLGESKV